MNTRILTGLVFVAGMAVTASGQIVGSDHDFTGAAWADSEICKPCHTPHFAMPGIARLWNHELTTANYTMHGGSGTAVDNFDVRSRLCLSCHDGTVALDSFGGQTGSSFINPGKNLGTDLTDDHPVGSDALYPPDPQPSWWASSFADEASLPFEVALQDWDDGVTVHRVVSCVTCHEPHNEGGLDMMVMDNGGSDLCLTCHLK